MLRGRPVKILKGQSKGVMAQVTRSEGDFIWVTLATNSREIKINKTDILLYDESSGRPVGGGTSASWFGGPLTGPQSALHTSRDTQLPRANNRVSDQNTSTVNRGLNNNPGAPPSSRGQAPIGYKMAPAVPKSGSSFVSGWQTVSETKPATSSSPLPIWCIRGVQVCATAAGPFAGKVGVIEAVTSSCVHVDIGEADNLIAISHDSLKPHTPVVLGDKVILLLTAGAKATHHQKTGIVRHIYPATDSCDVDLHGVGITTVKLTDLFKYTSLN